MIEKITAESIREVVSDRLSTGTKTIIDDDDGDNTDEDMGDEYNPEDTITSSNLRKGGAKTEPTDDIDMDYGEDDDDDNDDTRDDASESESEWW
jgi:hypothetical protein